MKRIMLVNGNPKVGKSEFDAYCQDLVQRLTSEGNEVRLVTLRDKTIGDCIGCYACWLKTPGICALNDDQVEILKGYVWADLVILASPVIMGFVSSLLKKTNDRMIPLAHPFLRLDQHRMAHFPRYDLKVRTGLLIDSGNNADPEDVEIIKKVYHWTDFIKTMHEPVEEVAHEINHF
jgi:multimeric flavodoxin WrbA